MKRLLPLQILLISSFAIFFSLSTPLSGQWNNFYQYRTYDGLFNDLRNFHEGKAGIALRRKDGLQFYSADGYSMINRGNPRMISNEVCDQSSSIPNDKNLSSLVFTFLQFIDHDIVATVEGHEEYHPIPIPRGDKYFDPFYTGRVQIPFFRSKKAAQMGLPRQRNQINGITAWLDGSVVYGSDAARAAWLRSGECGKLKVSSSPTGDLLPYNTTDGEYGSPLAYDAPAMAMDTDARGIRRKVFVAGDVRANEQPGLTALHTLFVREHNRICDELVARGQCNDERNYQYARKMVGGFIQSILYNELFPYMGVHPGSEAYNRDSDPAIYNTFATAAYRLGHTMITDRIPLIDSDCAGPDSELSLAEAFFNPGILWDHGIEPILRGLHAQTQQEIDVKLVGGVRNFLFGPPGAGGLDLAALNIQRGRDHGIPSYNEGRKMFNLPPARSFSDITSNYKWQRSLKRAYNNDVNRVDCWIGMLAEDHMPGKIFGEFINEVLSLQFREIRQADRFYYTRDPILSRKDIQEIDRTTLADIIIRNTEIYQIGEAFYAGQCDGIAQSSYCPSGGKIASYEWIDFVNIEEYTNESGENGGYAYFTNSNVEVGAGERLRIFAKTGYRYWRNKQYWKIWVDWNGDGDFSRNELAYSSRQYGHIIHEIRVPWNASEGKTRMRILMSHYNQSDPCGEFKYGETEDYDIVIRRSLHANSRSGHPAEKETAVRSLTDLSLFPNPVDDVTRIQFNSPGKDRVYLRIHDISGQLVHENHMDTAAGINQFTLRADGFSPGTYIATIYHNNDIRHARFVVAR